MSDNYEFQPHERPIMPGSPASPVHPNARRAGYFLIGAYLGLAGGMQNGLMLANINDVQSSFALTPVESGWISVAFTLTNLCMSIVLFKARQEFGVQRFVRLCVLLLLATNFAQLFHVGYRLEIVSRALGGIAASGVGTLAVFYMMQAFPPGLSKLKGMILAIGLAQIALPMARALSPALMVSGDIARLFQFQFALSLGVVGLVFLLRLPPGETKKTFETLDFLSFPLLAAGLGCMSVFLVQGRILWWTTPWLGWVMAAAVLLIGATFWIEHNRANPMLATRWMSRREIVALALTAGGIRIVQSEQNFGAFGLLSSLGFTSDQLVTYNWIVAAGGLCGLTLSLFTLNVRDLRRPAIVTMAIFTAAAVADSGVTGNIRPSDFYLSQFAVGFASLYFMGSVLMEGIIHAFAKGAAYLISFIAVFGISQTLGGLGGAAVFSAFHTLRTKAHLMVAGEHLSATDPVVAAAIQNRAAALVPMGDPALRQATGVSQLIQQTLREATILAYNDFFWLVGTISAMAFIAMFLQWVYHRYHDINPLEQQMIDMADNMRKASQR